MVTSRRSRLADHGLSIALVLGLLLPLGVGLAVSAVVLARSPLESSAPPEPVVAQVGRADRVSSQPVVVAWVPAEPVEVRSQSSGTVTDVTILPDVPIASGQAVLAVDGLPVVAYVSAAPLYRDIGGEMAGEDVRTAQRLLVDLGYLQDADGVAGASTVHAITRFNADRGRGDGGVLAVGSMLWVPEGAGAPQEVAVRVGDSVGPQVTVYLTSSSADQVTVAASAVEADRILSVGEAEVPLPAGTTSVTDQEHVAVLREALAGEPSRQGLLTAQAATEVGTVPASAVVVEPDGTACYLTSAQGAAVHIEPESGLFGVVDVDPSLIGTPVLVNPRQIGVDPGCG